MNEHDEGPRLDVTEEHPPAWAVLDAAEVLRALLDDGGGRWSRRRVDTPPVLRFTDRFLVGPLDLRAREVGVLLEFVRCRFTEPPDLRQAKLAGCEFDHCWLPGLDARNLHSDNDVALRHCIVDGAPLDLRDAELNGSCTLIGTKLVNPGGLALYADRLTVKGALLASRLRASGVLRLSGLSAGGNVNFRGAELSDGPNGVALEARGLRVSGSLLCTDDPGSERPFQVSGTVLLTNASLAGDLVLGGARLHSTGEDEQTEQRDYDPRYDVAAALVGDRMQITGNVKLDDLTANSTLRMVNANIGGSLSLDRAKVDVSAEGEVPDGRRALRLDAAQIAGDLRGWESEFTGQLRLVDLTVRGSVLLDRATLRAPQDDVVHARRLSIGGNLDCRDATIEGSVLLQGAGIGANLDLRGSTLSAHNAYSRDQSPKPSLNIRTATIGRDLTCAANGRRSFRTEGEVRMNSATVAREANFDGAELGSDDDATALSARGAVIQDLVLRLARPARGRIVLRHARCATLADDETLWTGRSGVDLDDFRYDALAEPVPLTHDAEVGTRLSWLRSALRHEYVPGPYDQLAAMFRASGNEEHAATVLIEKQQDRYRALARGYRVLGPGVRLWSLVQWSMVGYGYRPIRALVWLLGLLVFGSLWFGVLADPCATQPDLVVNGPRCSVSVDDTGLVWNPFLYTLDLLVPIVDFGNKARWYMAGADQWISAALTAMGWILATTVAAGFTRSLRGGDNRPMTG